jgi:hypothetical protein
MAGVWLDHCMNDKRASHLTEHLQRSDIIVSDSIIKITVVVGFEAKEL